MTKRTPWIVIPDSIAPYWLETIASDRADDGQWKTTSRGKHYQINGEGTVIKGNIGATVLVPARQTGKDIVRSGNIKYTQPLRAYAKTGDPLKDTHAFYQKELMSKTVTRRVGNTKMEVHFTGSAWSELRKAIRRDRSVCDFIPFLPDVIQNGSHVVNELYKKRSDNFIRFHIFKKRVYTDKGHKTLQVKVGERAKNSPKYIPWYIVHDSKKIPSAEAPTWWYRGARTGFIDESISPFYEIVNIRISKSA